MRRRNRRVRHLLLPHGDSKYLPFRFLSLNSNTLGFVIPSEARDLQFAAKCRSLASLGMTNHESEARTRPQQTLRSSTPEPKAGTAAQTPPRSSAENARHRRHRSTGDRTRVRAAESSAARICCSPTPAPSANAKGRESLPRDDSKSERIPRRRCPQDWGW